MVKIKLNGKRLQIQVFEFSLYAIIEDKIIENNPNQNTMGLPKA